MRCVLASSAPGQQGNAAMATIRVLACLGFRVYCTLKPLKSCFSLRFKLSGFRVKGAPNPAT